MEHTVHAGCVSRCRCTRTEVYFLAKAGVLKGKAGYVYPVVGPDETCNGCRYVDIPVSKARKCELRPPTSRCPRPSLSHGPAGYGADGGRHWLSLEEQEPVSTARD